MSTESTTVTSKGGLIGVIGPYVSIARPDHWFKNVFMLGGVVLAAFYSPDTIQGYPVVALLVGLIAACLIASSNYVINEVLDAPKDREHPVKRLRPVPSGRVKLPIAYAEWIVLGIIGCAVAWTLNVPFFLSALMLWIMGFFYNVRPFRTKEVPYVDVISESVNNPLRLLMGWFVITPDVVPPVSLLVAYWMVGAFFMASKRFAEYRMINDPVAAAAYRSSFRHYNDERLLVSMFFYTTFCTLMLGVFIVRYKLELLLSVPFLAGFFAYYLHVTFKEDSPVQNPEHLYKQTGLMIYLAISVFVFFGLLFVEVPGLYELFNVTPSKMKALWTFGGS
jgi:4-hydroxybenzoate polyprenyltransferase